MAYYSLKFRRVPKLKKDNAVNIGFHDEDSISVSRQVEIIDDVAKKKIMVKDMLIDETEEDLGEHDAIDA